MLLFSDLVALVAASAAVADAVIAVAGVVLVAAAAVAVVATASATGKQYTDHIQRPLTRLHPSLMPGFQGCGTEKWGRQGGVASQVGGSNQN